MIHFCGTGFSMLQMMLTSAVPNSSSYGSELLRIKVIIFPVSPSIAAFTANLPDSTPFDNVDEAADFPEMDEPTFVQVEYKIKKKGGILKMTAELLEDTAANIMAYINKWIAKKTKATRNAMILKTLDAMTKGKESN